jgi:hypothetical protein
MLENCQEVYQEAVPFRPDEKRLGGASTQMNNHESAFMNRTNQHVQMVILSGVYSERQFGKDMDIFVLRQNSTIFSN